MTTSLRAMTGVFVLALAAAVVAACMPATPGVTGSVTPSPTACATVTPAAGGTAVFPTQTSGRSNPATLMPFPPTVSPEMAATMMARMGNANPGAPTTPAGPAPGATVLPPCWTPTPTR